jgi:hypothetical protein
MFGECGTVIDVEMVVDFDSRSFLVYFMEKESVSLALRKHVSFY